ncbi:MAG: aspartate--tRNA ligase [Alphaproteobacteria bacterium]|nr:aspartate--tRNA ligase [Alphaproteobacteria bacterium]
MHRYRSHTCGALRPSHVGETVRIAGWIHRKRDHGQLLFLDLRDHYGLTQCVIETDSPGFAEIEAMRPESVISVTGPVVARSAETVNARLATGYVEVRIAVVEMLSPAAVLPMQLHGEVDYPEETRLRYRFLDLRREKMQQNLLLRSRIIASIRRRMIEQGFVEFQTPILTASSPEGARDFLVPSRLHQGKFYALPQAPQQFKQLIMASGFDRYFQIAPCFRDEDARADRSPGEFYQLDLEMAFVEQEDVFQAVEPVIHGVFAEFSDRPVTPRPFPRIPYREALLKYGTDKPDLRNPILIADATEVFRGTEFKVFAGAIEKGAVVRAIPAPGAAARPRSFFDKLNAWAREQGAAGLGYVILEGGAGKGPIARFLDGDRLARLKAITGAGDGDAVFFACEAAEKAAKLAGEARGEIGRQLGLVDEKRFAFCWIVDFPMYERNPDTGAIEFSHNPFSMPQGGLEGLAVADPLAVLAYQYDIVCNGVELSSGAIRNHRPDVMRRAFAIAGYGEDELERRFGGLYHAFQFGTPPHGGIAPGIDRIVMLLAGEPNIREVILFPLNQQAVDLMMNAPSEVPEKHLRELGIMPRPQVKAKPEGG